jgi:hypothetical protein
MSGQPSGLDFAAPRMTKWFEMASKPAPKTSARRRDGGCATWRDKRATYVAKSSAGLPRPYFRFERTFFS